MPVFQFILEPKGKPLIQPNFLTEGNGHQVDPQAQPQLEPQHPALKRTLDDTEQELSSPNALKKQRIDEFHSPASNEDYFTKCLADMVAKINEAALAMGGAAKRLNNGGPDFALVIRTIYRVVGILQEVTVEFESYMKSTLTLW